VHIHLPAFAADARHAEIPLTFTHNRQLPLPKRIGVLLSMRGTSQQIMVNFFLAAKDGDRQRIFDRGFAQARNKLAWSVCIPAWRDEGY
jgi:hypothetical protein